LSELLLFSLIEGLLISFPLFSVSILGLGRYSHYQYSIDTETKRLVTKWSSCCTDTDDGDSRKTTTIFPAPKLFVSHLTFIQLSKRLKHIEFDLNYVELILFQYNYGTFYTGDYFALALVFFGFTV